VELTVREARLTDIDRVSSLIERADDRWSSAQLGSAADLLRQLVYLPNAAVIVVMDGRQLMGLAVLTLRPSVASGGLIGNLDLLAVEPGHEYAGVSETLVNEVIRSARNKGCVLLEVPRPGDPGALAQWEALGFDEEGVRLSRSLTGSPAAHH